MSIDTEIEKFSNAKTLFLKTIDNLSQDEMTHPNVEGVWSIKDIIGHLTSWQMLCVQIIEGLQLCKPAVLPYITDENVWNNQQAENKRELSFDRIITDYNTVHQMIIDGVNGLTPEQQSQIIALPWGEQNNLEGMLSGLAWHEDYHRQAITSWLAKKK